MNITPSSLSEAARRAIRAFTASRSRSISSTSREMLSSFLRPSHSINAPHAKLRLIAMSLRGCIRAAPHVRSSQVRPLPSSASFILKSPPHASSSRMCSSRRYSSRRSTSLRCVSPPTLPSRSTRPSSATFHSSCPRDWSLKASARSSRRLAIAELTTILPAEIFRGGSFEAGTYSFLLRVRFQSAERTLRDDEVANWSQQIVKAVESFGGSLRQ